MCHSEEDVDTADTASVIPKHMHTYKDSQSPVNRCVGANATLLITAFNYSQLYSFFSLTDPEYILTQTATQELILDNMPTDYMEERLAIFIYLFFLH